MGLFDRLIKRKPTPEQLERLSRITNPDQRRALSLAIQQGEQIPEYAWNPLPEDLDPAVMVRRAREASEALQTTEAQGGTDLGLEVLEFIYENMEVDEEWSIREGRGFTWWGHRLAQRVWVEPAREDDGHEIFRLHGRTDLLRNLPASLDTAHRVAVLNKFASLSAFVWEPTEGRVSLHCSVYVHAQTAGWLKGLFLAAIGIQVADAHIKVDELAKLLRTEPNTSAHPTSGPRPDMDEMLDVIETHFAPHGQGASPFTESDFAAAVSMQPNIWISPKVEGSSLQAVLWDRPAERGTGLLYASAKDRHPQLGSGVLLRTSIPVQVERDKVSLLAHELNRMELDEVARCHFLGAWCPDNNPELGLTFVTFLPAATYRKGLLDAICLSMGVRALWANKRLPEVFQRANVLTEKVQELDDTNDIEN